MSRKEIVVFDFDRTLTSFDTSLDFFQFCGRKKGLFLFKYYLYLIFWTIQRVGLINNLQLKNIGVKLFVKVHNADEINKLAQEFSQKIKLNQIYYKDFKNENLKSRVLIVSAAFEIYLKHLFPDVEIHATSLIKKEGKYVEVGEHVYASLKKVRLEKAGVFKIDRLYTDSVSDLSLAKISDQCKLVVNNEIVANTSSSYFKTLCQENIESPQKNYRSILLCRYQNLG